jgi:hypothetical protein
MPRTIPISKYVPKKFGKIEMKNLSVFKLEAIPKSSPIDLNVSAPSEGSGWSQQKQKLSEDWEFRRYHANQVHFATAGLMEVFFAAKTEIYFLACTLETLLAGLNQLATQADAIVRQQGGPQLTIAELEQRKTQLLQPFQTYNAQQVTLR